MFNSCSIDEHYNILTVGSVLLFYYILRGQSSWSSQSSIYLHLLCINANLIFIKWLFNIMIFANYISLLLFTLAR